MSFQPGSWPRNRGAGIGGAKKQEEEQQAARKSIHSAICPAQRVISQFLAMRCGASVVFPARWPPG